MADEDKMSFIRLFLWVKNGFQWEKEIFAGRDTTLEIYGKYTNKRR